MPEYQIVTDVTSDLWDELIDQNDLAVIPMAFEIEGKNYIHYPDGRELGFHEFYQKLRNGGMAVTTQINYNIYMNYFEPFLESGRDVLYIALSSGLSSTFNASMVAAGKLKEKYPERKVICIDSLSASGGEGLLVWAAAQKKAEGYDIEALKDWVMENRLHVCQWFTVDDLMFLKRGGRVSATAAVAGTILGVKPLLHVDNNGLLIPMAKVRGQIKAMETMLDQFEKTATDIENQVVFINHGDCPENAKKFEGLLRKRFKVKDVKIGPIGPVIGTHSGPGTLCLFFFGRLR